MAKRKRGGGDWAYFGKIFRESPRLVNEKSNDAILARYRKDHGLADEAEIDKKVRNNLANYKSVLRKKLREEGKGGGKGGNKAGAVAAAGPRRAGGRLEELELLIDECMSLARGFDREGLEEVIGHLRRARREVVWKMGEK